MDNTPIIGKMEKLKIDRVIVVEGRYDAHKVSQYVDAPIVTTEGFGIFKDQSKRAHIESLAKSKGVIILTDNDRAGFLIRNHLKSIIDPKYIEHAYVRSIEGKERRKAAASKEGLLGVEGSSRADIMEALTRCAPASTGKGSEGAITLQDLYDDGFIGGKNSRTKRQTLQSRLNLPRRLSSKALLSTLNILMTHSEYKQEVESMYNKEEVAQSGNADVDKEQDHVTSRNL